MRIDRMIALLMAGLALFCYWSTLAPDLLAGDAGEFQFAAWRFGVAHPTGYPLYLLIGGAWQHLLAWAGISPAVALNSFSAVIGASAVGVFYLLVFIWLGGTGTPPRLGAILAASILATNPVFWSQNLIAEVYTLHALFLILLLCVVAVIERDAATHKGSDPFRLSPNRLILCAFLFGLSMTHHATTILLAPALVVYLTLVERGWWRQSLRVWFLILSALILPLLLYVYIPLRSGPSASPWLHPMLGEAQLNLITNDWHSLLNFITGRSISVGFYHPGEAWATLPSAGRYWLESMPWPLLLWIPFGLLGLSLYRPRLLALTFTFALVQQIFNLFYAIGDIVVYYIPLFLLAAFWAGSGLTLLLHHWKLSRLLVWLLSALTLLLVLREAIPTILSGGLSQNHAARNQWETILAAQPPAGAILVSNDRDEMVPLYYLQHVEGRAQGITGIFPLMAPDARFADLGATLETALGAGAAYPVYLIKEMDGLQVRFALEPAAPPLVRVTGSAVPAGYMPQNLLDLPYGSLRLLGYDTSPASDAAEVPLEITLYWRVEAEIDGDYTTTVQLFDDQGRKVAQDDRVPGGVYYPTSLWKIGEVIADHHQLSVIEDATPDRSIATLLVALYRPFDMAQLAPALEIGLTP